MTPFSPPSPGAFIVCWTPGLVLLLLDVFCEECNVLAFEKFFLLLAEFNSAMNPIIYSYRDKEMSVTFKQILCCQRQENINGTVEGSDRSASSFNHSVLSPHNNDHSVVWTQQRNAAGTIGIYMGSNPGLEKAPCQVAELHRRHCIKKKKKKLFWRVFFFFNVFYFWWNYIKYLMTDLQCKGFGQYNDDR